MTPTLLQIVMAAAFTAALVLTAKRGQQGAISRAETFGWGALWVAAAVVTMLPEVSSAVARLLGVGRGVDVVVYVSVAALFYLVFRIFVRLDKIDREITEIVRIVSVMKSAQDGARGNDEAKK